MASLTCSPASLAGTRVAARGGRAGRQLAVRCQAAQAPDSRRQVLGLGLLFAATAAAPALAELAADPDVTKEVVKTPESAKTKPAKPAGDAPTADVGGDLVAKLKARSEQNKALNDRKRLSTSYANLAGSRTVADGTCTFPNNLFGCDNRAVAGKVKYIADDRDIECKGKPEGKCGSNMEAKSIPKAFTK